MTKVAVLIPSHIYYDNQLKLLDLCISSIINQTKIPDIYISISFSNKEYQQNFGDLFKKYRDKVTFKFSRERLYQMEHIYNLYIEVKNKHYDILMFCDDDDAYNVTRVEQFIEAFEDIKGEYKSISGVKEIVGSKNPELEIPEYWSYGIVPDVLGDFFNQFNGNEKLFKYKFGDMYFRNYLRRNKSKHCVWACIAIPYKEHALYNYNIENPNSICGSLNKNNVNVNDQIILRILNCRSDNEIKELMKLRVTPRKMIPYYMHIYGFCKLLYK